MRCVTAYRAAKRTAHVNNGVQMRNLAIVPVKFDLISCRRVDVSALTGAIIFLPSAFLFPHSRYIVNRDGAYR